MDTSAKVSSQANYNINTSNNSSNKIDRIIQNNGGTYNEITQNNKSTKNITNKIYKNTRIDSSKTYIDNSKKFVDSSITYIDNRTIYFRAKTNTPVSESKSKMDVARKTDANKVLILKETLNGSWVGNLTQVDKPYGYGMVLQINIIQNRITGTVQITDERNQYINAKFSITGTFDENQAIISDINVVSVNGERRWYIKEYIGELTQKGKDILFSGSWNNDSCKIYDWGQIKINPHKSQGGNFILKKINN